jgi:hypothetical protein
MPIVPRRHTQRPTLMSALRFRAIGERIFSCGSPDQWQHHLADALHLNHATVWRYAGGHLRVPPVLALLLESLLLIKAEGGTMPTPIRNALHQFGEPAGATPWARRAARLLRDAGNAT